MAIFGLSDDDFPADDFLVWPDNWKAVTNFSCLQTQWRMGMSGPIGLDYNTLPTVFRMTGLPETEWSEMFQSIRVMESAALAVLHEKE